MSRVPNAAFAVVEPAKISSYLLVESHPEGGPKAVFFKRFGFDLNNSQALVSALLMHVATHPVTRVRVTIFGAKYEVTGPLLAPDGRLPKVKSVWAIDHGTSIPRFITAFPD